MISWGDGFEPQWMWLTIGLFLAAAEIAMPGALLIWLAGAAIVTGLLVWLIPFGMVVQSLIFIMLAMFALSWGRRYLRAHAEDPLAARAIGAIATVTQPIGAGGGGRVELGGSEWAAHGPDLPTGATVRVTGADGAVLLVEPI